MKTIGETDSSLLLFIFLISFILFLINMIILGSTMLALEYTFFMVWSALKTERK